MATLTNGNNVSTHSKRPLRIAGASGGVFDRFRSIQDFAKDSSIDVIFGDWISEISMTFRGTQRAERSIDDEALAFEQSFLAALAPAIPDIAKNKIKVAVNAGSCDAEALAQRTKILCKDNGVDLKISYVVGDDVTEQFKNQVAQGEEFRSLPSDTPIRDWGLEPICAQAYLGGFGITEALRDGADIVICGRVADASPVIGAAAWWHGWQREDFNKLAYALVAGHLIECSTYVTGGYWTGFKQDLLQNNNYSNLGFPIAEIEADGGVVITKEADSGGIMTVHTCTAQLVYEIQGPLYYNSDVTARIDKIKLTQEAPDRVRLEGVEGLPPPPTTKVGITARGGSVFAEEMFIKLYANLQIVWFFKSITTSSAAYLAECGWQAEFHFFLTGLDVAEKAEMIEKQTRASMGEFQREFTTLRFYTTGSVATNPTTLDEATVDFRIFAQSKNPDIMSAGKHKGVAPDTPSFAKWAIENCLQGYPGGTPAMDLRQATGKPFFEYWAALFPQALIKHEVRSLDGKTISIPPPTKTQTYPRQQESYDSSSLPTDSWGETINAPLGYIVHGRSGDKSSDCNVGFFVRHDDEYDWLRSLLSIAKIKELLAAEYQGGKVDRFEFPYLNAVHFLLKDHLDRGANSSSSHDILGKQVCEFIRSRHVPIPKKFLDRGRI